MKAVYEIHREGHAAIERVVSAYSLDDALNEFADYLEHGDVPAFYHRDVDTQLPYILADGERYFAYARKGVAA